MIETDKTKNTTSNQIILDDLLKKQHLIYQGGGSAKIEKQHVKGKLTARERIDYLMDADSEFYELGLFAGYEMYKNEGGCPAGGVIVGIGNINQRQVIVVANDATVKAGAWFPITCKKNLRAQEIAIENRLPIVYLVDSAGVFLPMQDEIFPDKEHFGRVFRNNAILSSMGVPQISAIMGSCVAGGAYLPIMSDESIIVKGTGSIFLAGPYLVKAAIGENVDQETLGGASTHSEISGVTDYAVETDEECLDKIKDIVGNMGIVHQSHLARSQAESPSLAVQEILSHFPEQRNLPYDSYKILDCIVDRNTFTEYKAGYGQTIICGYGKVDGWHVGIVMNNRAIVKTKKGEVQIGGVIYSDSADKATRFILNCNQKKIPLVFLHDVTGFMVGSRSEHGGIIKDGAKMVNAVANSTVPKISIILGNSNGAGNYAMCGKAYDPRFIFAWPTAQIAVMGGSQATKVLLQIEESKKQYNEDDHAERLEKIKQKYERETSAYYAAARLWVDEIIRPDQTREYISMALKVAQNAAIKPFNTGVIQT
ncbi:acyl-CoA carboxylase subunit beta [Membranihabitans marinus]|uniref:acyl-CoA carboxylase subunit beta n=1 Tax=Membranihabitans marinus TaxID=1227546 RepID=UPI001F1C9055|nr:acyl-CoA carboxylase subunit beta [Membranihabitans marinus]